MMVVCDPVVDCHRMSLEACNREAGFRCRNSVGYSLEVDFHHMNWVACNQGDRLAVWVLFQEGEDWDRLVYIYT